MSTVWVRWIYSGVSIYGGCVSVDGSSSGVLKMAKTYDDELGIRWSACFVMTGQSHYLSTTPSISGQNMSDAEAAFLTFLAKDIAENPHRLVAIDQEVVRNIEKLVGDVDIDLDAALSMDDE